MVRLLVCVVLGRVKGESRVDRNRRRRWLLMHLVRHGVLVRVVEGDGLGRVG